jgi:hypothetical protein
VCVTQREKEREKKRERERERVQMSHWTYRKSLSLCVLTLPSGAASYLGAIQSQSLTVLDVSPLSDFS